MKRIAIAVILLISVTPVNGIYSQRNDPTISPNLPEVTQAQNLPRETGTGQTTYYTYPEFNGIMTTTVTIPAQNTADGYIFTVPFSPGENAPPALLILDDAGEPVYIKLSPNDKSLGDFKKQTVNGTDYLTYHSGIQPGGYTFGTSYVLDGNYQEVDAWTIDNGHGSDIHDFQLLDNGHAILMAYVPIPFDLSPYGGPVNGSLIDIVLQEQDADKNVVFEWHASQHMPIDDTEINLNTTQPIDYLHTNAIEVDDDGNWLLSHRHFSEITKIDRQTGEIIWRLGGSGNEFTFTNDIGFFNQHDIRRLENGNITIFDNGNQHDPPHSRAIEYEIDEIAKTVTRVWAYPDDTSEYAQAMGNFQRLPNGNSFIGWGTGSKFTEVLPDGTVALEILMATPNYRSFRFPWSGAPTADPRAVIQYESDPTAVTLYTGWNGATDIVSYDVFAGPTMGSMAMVGNEARSGFETEISLAGLPPNTCFFQTQPVHGQGDPTPFSNVVFRPDIPACLDQLQKSYLPTLMK